MGGGRRAMAYSTNAVQQDQSITDFQNFLKDAPLVSFNMKPDAEGKVVFKNSKLAKYSTL